MLQQTYRFLVRPIVRPHRLNSGMPKTSPKCLITQYRRVPILFELWSGSIARSEAARDKAMKGYKSQMRALHDGVKARPCITAYPSAPENRQLPRVMAQKRTHRHLFLKDLQTPAPDSGSAPKQETLTPRRRIDKCCRIPKNACKGEQKKLADAIRRFFFCGWNNEQGSSPVCCKK